MKKAIEYINSYYPYQEEMDEEEVVQLEYMIKSAQNDAFREGKSSRNIKKLEFVPSASDYGIFGADTPFGMVFIHTHMDMFLLHAFNDVKTCLSFEDAEKTAQEDFEQRINKSMI